MADLTPVFAALRAVLAAHGAGMAVKQDDAVAYWLDVASPGPDGKARFFGAVQLKTRFVSYHLMPVYTHPHLLDGLSPALKARMQGKSCFNFTRIDPALFTELAALTARARGTAD